MTGFGSAALRNRDLDLEVEIRSVNHRFLVLKQGLPEGLSRCDAEVEQQVRGRLARGSVTVSVSAKRGVAEGPALPDPKTVKTVARRLKDLARAAGVRGPVRLEDLLSVPGLWSASTSPADAAALAPELSRLVGEALDALVAARAREGAKIGKALEGHLKGIEEALGLVETRVPAVVEAYQKRLDDRIQQLLAQKGLEAAKPDLVKEVAVFADRCDTSEEIQRLRAHIGEFRKMAGQKGPVGRRLDFLAQEMGRETNTIASKGNDARIAAAAVAMKAELEKIKEQVENVE